MKDIQTESVPDRIKAYLEANPGYGYTIGGLLVEIYGYNPKELNASFGDWPKGAPSQYTRIRLALKQMQKDNLVNSTKQGKKVLYWWRSS